MALGGVPYYWSKLRKGLSLPQNINQMFLHQNKSKIGERFILRIKISWLFVEIVMFEIRYVEVEDKEFWEKE